MRHVRDAFLNQPDHLLLGARMEDISALAQQRLQILGHVSSRHVDAPDAVGHGEALVDRHGVRYAVAGIQNYACCSPGGVQRQDGLDGGVERGHVEGLEEDLGGCVAVCARVEGWFG